MGAKSDNTKPGSHFEDYPVGAVFAGGPIVVTEQEILDFARRHDPQPMHVDKEAAKRGPYGEIGRASCRERVFRRV